MDIAASPRDMVRSGLCIGCGSCVAQAASADAGMGFDAYGQLRPNGGSDWSRDRSAEFARICPFSPVAVDEDRLAAELFADAATPAEPLGLFRAAYVGYAAEQDFRRQGSSGGMATWVATELLKKGWVTGVAHVVATESPSEDGRFFRYRLSRSETEVRTSAKSRYYPVDLSEVLKTIRDEPGRYAVIGIPCFIKAVQLLRRENPLFRERIRYTLGLFCGHMKSARFVESLAWQMNVALNDVQRVDFRSKSPDRPASWYSARLTLHDGRVVNKDWWHLADGDWGAGFFMDAACNFCDDVVAETADVSFGDAWVEPHSSDWQGTNVVVVRSPDIANLVTGAIHDGRLTLESVDAGFVAQTQAAGLRQRREGLAYRLARRSHGLQPRKRVAPDAHSITARRRLTYRIRYWISAWSHQAFRLARWAGMPRVYLLWATMAAALYHALAYHRGRLGGFVRRLGLK
jgi:coenzyme F420-reducing hydrogenase beta subunit